MEKRDIETLIREGWTPPKRGIDMGLFQKFIDQQNPEEQALSMSGVIKCSCMAPIPMDDRTGGKTCRICMRKVNTL